MRISIFASAVVPESDALGSIDRSTLAVRQCLARAGVDPSEVDLLVNTGIYRDDNLMEPAISALIQKHAGINLSYVGQPAPALSFDLMNGPCGFLDAIEVTTATFGAKDAGVGVIVSGDGHPARTTPQDVYFPYLPAAAAVLVKPSTDESGFGRVYRARSVAPQRPLGFIPLTAMGTEGRRTVTVIPPEESAMERGLEIAIDAAQRCLTEERIDPARTVLLSAEPRPGFAKSVAAAVGIDRYFTPETPGNPHSAALPFAYRAWLDEDAPGTAEHALFLAADGHSVAGCAPYRLP
ncbi:MULTISPECIES: hypothetical protein [unclassified Nocardia]|uniref:hypothetical protein n=1 Tax=unclassified Nocardia TaxID=2637762 RepID=UPI001CE4443F|nr:MULTISPECIES: hypothetical protein [unclassified Nocardia]